MHKFVLVDTNSPKNFRQDFKLENGKYTNQCSSCKDYFIGHKHRFTCRMCEHAAKYPHTKKTLLSLVHEAIVNDGQIKALHKGLSDLIGKRIPQYQINGEEINSEEYNKLFENFIEQIEHRQQEIISGVIKNDVRG